MFKSNFPKQAFGEHPVWIPTGETQAFNPFGAMALCSLGYIPGVETLIKGIEVPECEDLPVCDKEYTEKEIIKLMKRVIREQDFGVNPVLVSLSGGLDSRFIFALLVDVLGPDKVVAFTWGIPNCRDIVIAQEISKHLGVEQHIIVETNGLHAIDYASYFMEIVRGESTAFSVAPLLACNKTVREIGIEYIADGYFGEDMSGAMNRMSFPPLIITDKNLCFRKNYAKEYNEEASKVIVIVKNSNDPDHALTNLWFRTLNYRCIRLYQMPMEKEGYKLFPLFSIPEVFIAINSIPKRKRTRKWMVKILQQIKPSLCEIPYQQTGKAFVGNRQIDLKLPKMFFNEQTWLQNCRDWAMEFYSNTEAFEAFGMRPEKIKEFAEKYFSIEHIPGKFPPYWRVLKYSLSLSIFYTLVTKENSRRIVV